MAGFRYSPEVKSKILNVVRDARTIGRSWDEALTLAKEAGYNGSIHGIQKLVRDAEADTPQKSADAKTPQPANRRGRPRKKEAAPASALTTPSSGIDAVQQLIDDIVKQRIAAAFAKVKAALEEAERTA